MVNRGDVMVNYMGNLVLYIYMYTHMHIAASMDGLLPSPTITSSKCLDRGTCTSTSQRLYR